MTWWAWVILGLVLAAIELATPGGFFVIFFGVAAVVIGILEVAGLAEATWLQWLLFPVIAIVALRLFRKPLLEWLRTGEHSDRVDSLVDEVAIVSANLDAGQHGRAELRGSSWQCRNVDSRPLNAGQRARVVAVNGLILDIRSE
jgi:membrane protein implicated in regulation of membrane protease activity